jgi:hypothetical protein
MSAWQGCVAANGSLSSHVAPAPPGVTQLPFALQTWPLGQFEFSSSQAVAGGFSAQVPHPALPASLSSSAQ